jgi:hypothetical protein
LYNTVNHAGTNSHQQIRLLFHLAPIHRQLHANSRQQYSHVYCPRTTRQPPTQIATSYATEEAEIRDLVENFGKRLQNVSLQAPDAAQGMQKQYSEFVTPALLKMWMNDVSKAPGRIVSSPWPDRIEIITLSKEGTDRYELTGFVVEITSLEVVNGGAATKIPVRLVVQKVLGSWHITEYAEEQ